MANTGTGGEGIGRTILITPRLQEIEAVLRGHGLDVMTCPPLAIQPPQSFAALDEAIENLFGYDWLIFINEDAARFFLGRFIRQGHDVSELDSLRMCAIGEGTAAALEQSQAHVDVIATHGTAAWVVEQIANYTGGRESLRRLNFLIPQASIARGYPKNELEAADARADVVIAYQTVGTNDATRLSVLQSLLLTGSVDAVAFADQHDVWDFARVFDANDLGRLLKNLTVFVADQHAAIMAAQLGVTSLISESSSQKGMLEALIERFSI
jgi:uroporphyrinogen III methyltransferase/synthase